MVTPQKKDSSDKTKVERLFNPVASTNNTDKEVKGKHVTMGRTLNTSSARHSNVSMCHFSPHNCVTSSL